MAQVHLRGVKKSYDKLEVIHGIDMEIADGEFIVIVGPSGCGKSTLLRMVAGLERITGGQVAALMGGVILAAVFGFIDDRWQVRARWQLIEQLILAAVAIGEKYEGISP